MIISTEERLEKSADEVVHREYEASDYQQNIDRYTVMLGELPTGELPNNLLEYKGKPPDKIPPTVSLEDCLLIAQYNFRDELNIRIRCEHVELAKVVSIRAAVEAELPTDTAEKDTAIAAAVSRRAAALAAS